MPKAAKGSGPSPRSESSSSEAYSAHMAQRNRSLIETIVLTLTCALWTPWTLMRANRESGLGVPATYAREAWACALLCGSILLVRFTRPSLPLWWENASRTGLDSGILYGTSLVTTTLAAHMLQCEHAEVDVRRHAALNFWTSFACGLSVVVQLMFAGRTEQEPLSHAFLRMALVYAGVGGWVIERERWGQHAYLAVCLALFELCLQVVRRALKKSFTLGEAVLCCQLIAIASTDFLALTASRLVPNATPYYRHHRRPVDMALQGGMLGVVWLAACFTRLFRANVKVDEGNETKNVDPHLIKRRTSSADGQSPPLLDWHSLPVRDTIRFFLITSVFLGLVVSPWVAMLLPDNEFPVLWVYHYAFSKPSHLYVTAYWVVSLALGLPLIHYFNTRVGLSLIVIRKLYHIQALIMFAPAIAFEPDFTSLAFGVASALMLFLEYVRVLRVPPLGMALHRFMRTYTDSRDEGVAILTHLYLLIGCAAPVWMANGLSRSDVELAPFAGVLILGAGDAACAIVGSQWGKARWIGGRKTYLGTFAGVTATLSVAWGLILVGWCPTPSWPDGARRLVLATLATMTLEAFTTQIDNLVLPLFFAGALSL